MVAADLSRPERGLSSFLGLGISRGLGRDPAWVLHWRLLNMGATSHKSNNDVASATKELNFKILN